MASSDPHLAALRYEPPGALVSGADGLDAIREIAAQAPVHLVDDGWLLLEHGMPPVGLDGKIVSTVPIGAGMSSSAALTVSVGLAFTQAASYELERIELARIAQAAERLAVGVPVGLMDPASALLGRRGHALLLDCATEEHRLVPLPPEHDGSDSEHHGHD